jgi:type II secretory pathway pseudopilin PulG
MNRRRVGMGLVEVMLAIAIATALTSVLGVTVSRMFAATATAREHAHTMNALGRVAAQFRRDAHASVSATTASSAEHSQSLAFKTANDEEIQYAIVPEGIERRQFHGGQPRSQELFLIQGLRPLEWHVDAEHSEVVLTIGRLARPSADDDTLSGKFTIRAARRSPSSH